MKFDTSWMDAESTEDLEYCIECWESRLEFDSVSEELKESARIHLRKARKILSKR